MSIIAAGTTTTTALSSTGNTDGTLQFQVNGTTASVTLNTLGAIGVGSTPAYGSSGQVLTSAGSTAAPAWATPAAVNLATGVTGTLPITNGGTGTTSTTFANLTTNVTGTLPIANGGTNSTAAATAGGIGYGTGTAHAYTAVGTSGQALVSAGASAPAFGTLGIAGGGTNSTATATAGGIGYGTGTAHAYTAVGTAGQVLQSNGASAPTWVAAGGGSWVFLQTVTAAAAATADVETTFSSTYDVYVIVGAGVKVSANQDNLLARFKTDGSYLVGSYQTAGINAIADGSAIATFTNSSNTFVQNVLSTVYSQNTVNFLMYIYNASSTSTYKSMYVDGFVTGTQGGGGQTSKLISTGGTNVSSTAALTGVRFLASTGTITGTFRLYGIKTS
jgi:hypothetical protein